MFDFDTTTGTTITMAIWPVVVYSTAFVAYSWSAGSWVSLDKAAAKLPPFGWYNIFRPRALPVRPVLLQLASRPRRAQSRACHADARRWKRRRFVQSLRSAGL